MSTRRPDSTDGERKLAVARLRTAVAERSRLHRPEATQGKRNNVDESASLRAADDAVAARKRWLEAVDHGDY